MLTQPQHQPITELSRAACIFAPSLGLSLHPLAIQLMALQPHEAAEGRNMNYPAVHDRAGSVWPAERRGQLMGTEASPASGRSSTGLADVAVSIRYLLYSC